MCYPASLKLLSSFHGLLNGAHHVEGLRWEVVVLTRQNALEPRYGVF